MDIMNAAEAYFDSKIPENIRISFLEPQEYANEHRRLTKLIYGRSDSGHNGTLGYCLYDKKGDTFHVLIKDFGEGMDSAHTFNLFHELGHAETMPTKAGIRACCSTDAGSQAEKGYQFWCEYIAHYTGICRYLMKIGSIAFLDDRDRAKQKIRKLMGNGSELLYEAVLYSEMTGIAMAAGEPEIPLIRELMAERRRLAARGDIRGITVRELESIGRLAIELEEELGIR